LNKAKLADEKVKGFDLAVPTGSARVNCVNKMDITGM